MSKIVKVGVMPGEVKELVLEEGTTVAKALEIAGLNADGYEVKVDGNKVSDFNNATITSSTNLILLTQQVKGNAGGLVKIGVMPGEVKEYFVEEGTTIADAIANANIDPSGYEIKVDGQKVDPASATVSNNTSLILLTQQVKGN